MATGARRNHVQLARPRPKATTMTARITRTRTRTRTLTLTLNLVGEATFKGNKRESSSCNKGKTWKEGNRHGEEGKGDRHSEGGKVRAQIEVAAGKKTAEENARKVLMTLQQE